MGRLGRMAWAMALASCDAYLCLHSLRNFRQFLEIHLGICFLSSLWKIALIRALIEMLETMHEDENVYLVLNRHMLWKLKHYIKELKSFTILKIVLMRNSKINPCSSILSFDLTLLNTFTYLHFIHS